MASFRQIPSAVPGLGSAEGSAGGEVLPRNPRPSFPLTPPLPHPVPREGALEERRSPGTSARAVGGPSEGRQASGRAGRTLSPGGRAGGAAGGCQQQRRRGRPGIGSRRRPGPRGACAAHGRFWVNSLPRPGPRGSAAREEPPGAADSASRRRAPAAGTPRTPPPPPRARGYLRAPPWPPSPAVCTPRSRRGRWRIRPRS